MQLPIFTVFNLPPAERLAALRAALAAGADPNSVDADPSRNLRGETLLGRAFSVDPVSLDIELVQELLNHGANPLRGNMWCEETGEMEPMFGRVASMAFRNSLPPSDDVSAYPEPINPIGPPVMHAFLKACLDQGHTDGHGNDVLSHMVERLQVFSHGQFEEPIRHALAIGFPVDQPIEDDPNAVHYLLNKYMLSTVQAGMAPRFEAAWDFISDFIDAGIDMSKQNAKGFTAWEVVDSLVKTASDIPAYAKIQATRQNIALNEQTPSISISRRSSRL